MSKTVILIFALVLSALAVITVRSEDRIFFSKWANLEATGDRLNVEWGKLLLEKGAFAAHQRVGEIARRDLNMGIPTPEQTVLVYTGPSHKRPGPIR